MGEGENIMSKCAICDTTEIVYPCIDYSTGLTFCDSHLNETEIAFRHTSLAGTTDLSSWLRCIAKTRDNYHKRINSNKIHTAERIDINKDDYINIAINLIRDKVKDYTSRDNETETGKVLNIVI